MNLLNVLGCVVRWPAALMQRSPAPAAKRCSPHRMPSPAARRGGGRNAAVPVTTRASSRSRCRSTIGVIGNGRADRQTVSVRAQITGELTVGQLHGRRRRAEGPGALLAGSPPARSGAASEARGQPGSATSRRRRNARSQAQRYEDLADARHRDQGAGRHGAHGGHGARRDRRRRIAPAVENATVQLQMRDDQRAARRPHRRADGARRQPGPRQRHHAARRHQSDHADQRQLRHSRSAAARN